MEILANWQQPLLWASGLSLLALLLTIIGIPWVVTRLPHDYFAKPKRSDWEATPRRPIVGLVIEILKNVLGLVLVLLGLAMLVTPGQGIATLLIGLLLMNFPGKYRLERYLVTRPGVLRGLNWLRERRGKLPFDQPTSHTGEG